MIEHKESFLVKEFNRKIFEISVLYLQNSERNIGLYEFKKECSSAYFEVGTVVNLMIPL